jgi:hypothetical protein
MRSKIAALTEGRLRMRAHRSATPLSLSSLSRKKGECGMRAADSLISTMEQD